MSDSRDLLRFVEAAEKHLREHPPAASMSPWWRNDYSTQHPMRLRDLAQAFGVGAGMRRPDALFVDPMVWCWFHWDPVAFAGPQGTRWADFVRTAGCDEAQKVVHLLKRRRRRRRKSIERQVRRRKKGWR